MCKSKIKAKRRRFFCGRECARIYSAVGNWNITRRLVVKRDRHTCQGCGVNVKTLHEAWQALRSILPHPVWIEVGRLMRGRKGSVSKSWWECDHVKTVAESKRLGEQPDHSMPNLRVLCLRCHDVRKRERKPTVR